MYVGLVQGMKSPYFPHYLSEIGQSSAALSFETCLALLIIHGGQMRNVSIQHTLQHSLNLFLSLNRF